MNRPAGLSRRLLGRSGLLTLGAVAVGALTGFALMKKTHIRNFGPSFTYLKDPEFRKQQTGEALLTIDGAEFSAERFDGMAWRNIVFKNCEFVGRYDIGPRTMDDVLFEDCSFSGVLSFGVTHKVRFLRCRWNGKPVMFAEKGSRNTVFEDCRFEGPGSAPNSWGAVGSYGESEFVRCKARWFNLRGHAKLSIDKCEFEDVDCATDKRNSGTPAVVTITGSKLRGRFDLVASDLQSLTIRDTVADTLDLTNAAVAGGVLIERVKAGYINAYVASADSLSVRSSRIVGNGNNVFDAYAGGIRTIEIDNVVFGGGLSTEPVTIAGGTGDDLNNVRARVNESILVARSKIPRLNMHHVNTTVLQLKECEMDSLDLSHSRIAKLELTGNSIARSVDLTRTQVEQSKLQPFAKGQVKLEGSNIKPD